MNTDNNNNVIHLEGLEFKYATSPESPILNVPDWSVCSGEHVLVVGSSGSGKSTLLNLLSGILPAQKGTITVVGQRLNELKDRERDRFRATEIGYVAQSFNLIPYLSATDNIRLANYFSDQSGQNATAAQDDVDTILSELNIDESHWHKPVKHLSLGQQQRVAIARAIVNKPKLMIADEPTSSLDRDNRDSFMKLLMKTADAHEMTLLFVSHDLDLDHYFHRVDSISNINTIEA